ncbi:hypothetical protein [Bradyrhizobium sp. 164]|uniref:O-antigen ligase family protein n=1 Tax=Bradyrhizobium sp. 164 TaxID=2782637 RepID=UPI001FF9288A|nr:hypothetical protein [Bradyrhizobium sp. 164]MCK1597303.1 hypothetical protein [Bradyrhizobium sp. 164]
MSIQGLGRGGIARRPAAHLPAESNRLVAWLVLIGITLPSNMTVFIGGAKFIPARIVICLLLIPGLVVLFRKRRMGAPDLFVFAASAWMLGAIAQTDESWSSAGAVVLEFAGGYILARAYFFERPQLETFVQVLKPVTFAIIALAILEHLTKHNIAAALLGMPSTGHEYRYGLLRASSTFPHPILYGTFCTVAGAIFVYSESSSPGRILYGGLCLFGCLLAMSTAPLMAFAIVIAVYYYDRVMSAYHWRWQLMLAGMAAFLVIVFAVANKPVSWLVANMTLDPATGYFRVATWESAFYYINLSPYLGYGFTSYAPSEDFFANASVDAVWLTLSLRFGVPLVMLISLANIASFYRSGPTAGIRRSYEAYMNNVRTGFTLALAMLMFVGFTVHYWNNIWIFWGLCIGIRASLQEEYFKANESLGRKSGGLLAQTAPRFPQMASHPSQGTEGFLS